MQKINEIKKILIESGFSAVGSTLNEYAKITDKKKIPANAKSIFVGLIPYYSKKIKGQNISSYAVCKDYHKKAKEYTEKSISALKELFPNNNFIGFCDNSPFDEVQTAVLCGLGVKGENNLLITKEYGSYVFIAEIVTDLEIESEKIIKKCEGCFDCVKACPNGALSLQDNKVIFTKEKCLSFISQKKGVLSEEDTKSLKKSNLIWGCDICIDACPHNKNLEPCGLGLDENLLYNLKESDIEELSNREFLEKYKGSAFVWRGKGTLIRNIKLQ